MGDILGQEFGVIIVSAITFIGTADWLVAASWRESRWQAGLILFCVLAQLIVALLGLHERNIVLVASATVFCIGYAICGYIGATRNERSDR